MTKNKENINHIKNNNKIINTLVSVIIILIIFITILIVYLVISNDKYDKSEDKNKTKTTNTNVVKPNDERRDLSEHEQNDLLSFIDRYKLNYLASVYDGTITDANNRILLTSIYYINSIDANHQSYSIDDIKGYISRAFNINDIDFKDIICPLDNEILYKYLSDGNIYVLNETHPGHGGELLVDDLAHYVKKAVKEGDKYIIDILYLYGSEMDGYYVNNEELNISVDPYVEMTQEELDNYMKEYFFGHIDEYKSVGPYEYIFKKNGNSYYLYSVKSVS